MQVLRYRGVYTDGIFERVLQEEFEIRASVQPYRTIEADQIFEPFAGERIENIRIMYSREIIYPNDNSDIENPVSDIVVVLGEKFRPIKVEVWQHLSEKHYRTVLRKFDGN